MKNQESRERENDNLVEKIDSIYQEYQKEENKKACENNEANTKNYLIETLLKLVNYVNFDLWKEFNVPGGENGKIDYVLKKTNIAIEAKAVNKNLNKFENQVKAYSRSPELDNCDLLILTNGLEWRLFTRDKNNYFDFNNYLLIDLRKKETYKFVALLDKNNFNIDKILQVNEMQKINSFFNSVFDMNNFNDNDVAQILKNFSFKKKDYHEIWKEYLENYCFLNKNDNDLKQNKTEQKDNNIKIDYATLFNVYNLWNKKLYFVKNKNDFCVLRKSDNGKYCYYDGELKSFKSMAQYFAKKNGLNEENYAQGTNGLTPEGFENKNLYQIFNEFKNK